MKIKNIIAAATAIAILAVSMMGCASVDSATETQTDNANQIETHTDEDGITYMNNIPIYCECGACGAHIVEWYYVWNIDKTKKVPVCKFCNEEAINWDKEHGEK